MATNRQQKTKPTLVDPNNVGELFANDVANVGFVHGNFVVTLASLRADEPIGKNDPKLHRVVVGRIVLTNNAAGQLLDQLTNIAAHIEAISSPPTGQPN